MEKLLTASELATVLQLTEKALRNRLHRDPQSVPPPLAIHRRLRWRQRDVEQWLAAQVKGVTDA